jgi:hypothetical protein
MFSLHGNIIERKWLILVLLLFMILILILF